MSTFTVDKITEVWQPGSDVDVRATLDSILDGFHHPYNFSQDSPIQNLMFTEVLNWCNAQAGVNLVAFEALLARLDRGHMSRRLGEEAEHDHVDAMTAAHGTKTEIAPTTAHDAATLSPKEIQTAFVEKVGNNLEASISKGAIPGLGLEDVPIIKEMLLAPPTSDSPNPIDNALVRTGGIGLTSAFKGIEIHEIVAARGMGNILKDAVINMTLQDPERSGMEKQMAIARFGADNSGIQKDTARLLAFEPVSQPGNPAESTSKSPANLLRKGIDKLKLHR